MKALLHKLKHSKSEVLQSTRHILDNNGYWPGLARTFGESEHFVHHDCRIDVADELVVDIHLLRYGSVLIALLFVNHDFLDELVEDPGAELLEVGILPDQGEERRHIVIYLFAGGDGLRQRFLRLQQGRMLLLIVGHHGLVAFLSDLLQHSVLVELVGDFLQLVQALFRLPEFPPLLLGVLP